jgi:hypothetical protein
MLNFLTTFFITSNNDIIKDMDNNPYDYDLLNNKDYAIEYIANKDDININNKEGDKMSEVIKVDNQVNYFSDLANSAFGLINGYYGVKTEYNKSKADYNNSKNNNTPTNNKQNTQEIEKETRDNNSSNGFYVGVAIMTALIAVVIIKKI